MQVNPLYKKKVSLSTEETSPVVSTGGEQKKNEVMTWKDAAKVSLVLTLCSYFILFFVKAEFVDVSGDLGQFCFDTVQWFLAVFCSNFAALTGLATYIQKKTG